MTPRMQAVIDRIRDPRTYAVLTEPTGRVQLRPHPDCTATTFRPLAEETCPGCDAPLGYGVPVKSLPDRPTMHVECLAYEERDALEVAA